MSSTVGGKKGSVYSEGVLSQFKPDVGGGVKIVTHLHYLKEPYQNLTHIQDHFDSSGNYLRTSYNIKGDKGE